MKLGYIRVSREVQSLALQEDAMQKAGVDAKNVYHEKVSSVAADRPQLEELKKFARKDDTIVVWRLDRLGRSLKELIAIAADFQERGIHLQSYTENIDTSTPAGMLFFHMCGAFAQFERDLIRERTNAGLEAARARGKKGGNKSMVIDPEKLAMAKELYAGKKYDVKQIMEMLGMKSRVTFYKYVVHA